MTSLLGFKPDMWDYVTFGVLFGLVLAFLTVLVLVLGLPGRIAIARQHPDAEAVKLMGMLGFLAIVPWIQALTWAFKPATVIDVRRFPKQEQQKIEEQIAKLKGAPPPDQPNPTP